MTQVTHYNEFGTKSSRIVVSYADDGADPREVKRNAIYRAAAWNRTETREDMRVNFVLVGRDLATV